MIERFKRLFFTASVLSLIFVAGCGLKGPLKLPETDTLLKESFYERP